VISGFTGSNKSITDADASWPRFELLRIDQVTVRWVDQTAATHLALSVNNAKDGLGCDAKAKGRFRSVPVDLTAHADDPLALIQEDGDARPASNDTRPRRLLPSKKFDLPSLNAMNAQVNVDIAVFDLNTQALAPLSGLQTDLRLQEGVLTFNHLRAVAAGGTVAGSMQLDGRGNAAKWKADLALSGVDVARWLQVGRTGVPSSSRPVPYLTGKLAAKMVLDGTGQSTQDSDRPLVATERFS